MKETKKKGSISIYLAVIFLSIVLLLSVIGESARVSAVHAKAKSVTSMAADSVMAGYARQVYEDYGILLVWSKQDVEETLNSYIQANINMADIKVAGYDLMQMDVGDVKASKKVMATDKGGDLFVQQVSSYLKYAGISKGIEKLIKDSSKIKEGDSDKDVVDCCDDDTAEVAYASESIERYVTDLRNNKKLKQYNDELKRNITGESHSVRKGIKSLKKIKNEMEEINADIEVTLENISDYVSARNSILRRHKQNQVSDYVDDNKLLLEKILCVCEVFVELDVETVEDSKNPIELLNQYLEKSISVTSLLKKLVVGNVTEKDRENSSLFDTVKDLLNKGVLSLVVTNKSGWSDAAIDATDLPSNTSKCKSKDSSVTDKAALALYTYNYFGNYMDPKKDDALQYGLEYLASGKDSDQDNLASVVEKLVAIRHVPNMACLLGDSAKMTEIETIAASVAAVTGLPFLEPIAKGVLIEAWTLAESVCDVRALLNGDKLALVKTKENWRTSLTNLLPKDKGGDPNGLKYIAYLEGLIMLVSRDTITYRTMDLIQMNICKKYNQSFRMNECLMSFKGKASFYTSPILAGTPWMVAMLSDGSGSFKFDVDIHNEYVRE